MISLGLGQACSHLETVDIREASRLHNAGAGVPLAMGTSSFWNARMASSLIDVMMTGSP